MKNLELEIENYIESKRNNWSASTLTTARSKLRTLGRSWVNPSESYQKLLQGGFSRYTIKNYFVIAGHFEEERLKTRTYKKFLQDNSNAFKNCYQDKTRILRLDDYKKLISSIKNEKPEIYNLLVLMGQAGLRISEALSAKWEDLNDGLLTVVGKGQKQRQIPFNVSLLSNYKEKGLIVTAFNRRAISRHIAPFTPHDFRAFFATEVANHPELSIKDAALLLGHSSITTTSRYVRSDLNRIKKILNT